jgi:hypothetical protein
MAETEFLGPLREFPGLARRGDPNSEFHGRSPFRTCLPRITGGGNGHPSGGTRLLIASPHAKDECRIAENHRQRSGHGSPREPATQTASDVSPFIDARYESDQGRKQT